MKMLSKLCACLLVLLVVCSCVLTAYADGSVTYSGKAREFIFLPGSKYSPTDLFADFKNVMPGDSLTEQILIQNDTSKKVKIRVYMRSKGAQLGTDDFLSQMQLTVQQRGDSIMFAAPANQTAQLKDWVYLGTVYSGGKIILDVKLDVPITMGNDYQHNIGYVDWEFKIEELPIEPSDPRLPKTGDMSNIFLYASIMVISFTSLFLLLFFKKRKKKEDHGEA